MVSDTNGLETGQTPQAKLTVLHKAALTSVNAHSFGSSQATPTADQLSANSWVATASSRSTILQND